MYVCWKFNACHGLLPFHNTQGYEQVNNERIEAVTFNDHTQMSVITLGWKKSVFICVPY